RATNSDAMLPPAPGLLSTTTCWPHISESRAPMMRPTASMPPPGVNGTTSLTTRFGQPCANPVRLAKGTSAEAPAKPMSRRRSSMASLLNLDAGGLDDRSPEVDFCLEHSGELGRRRAGDDDAGLFQGGDDGRLAQDRNRISVDLVHNLGRRFGRSE